MNEKKKKELTVIKQAYSGIKLKTAVLVIVSLVVFTILSAPQFDTRYKYKENDIINNDIISDRDYEIIDEESVQKLKKEKDKTIQNVYIFDVLPAEFSLTNLEKSISFDNDTKIILNESNRLLNNIRKKGYFTGSFKEKDHKIGIEIKKILSDNSIQTIYKKDLKKIEENIINGKEELKTYLEKNIFTDDNIIKEKIKKTCIENIIPNFYFDSESTLNKIDKSVKMSDSIVLKIKKGSLIFEKGRKISHADMFIINSINRIVQRTEFSVFVKLFLLFLIFSIMITVYIHIFLKKMVGNITQYFVLASVLFINLVIVKLIAVFISVSQFINIASVIIFAIPASSAVFLTAILLYSRLSLIVNIFITLSIPLIFSVSLSDKINHFLPVAVLYFLTYLFSGTFSGLYMAKEKKRTSIIKAGIIMSFLNVIFLFLFYRSITSILKLSEFLDYKCYLAAFLNGLLFTPVLTIGTLPFFEYVFNLTTYSKLLELADVNTPLLKELSLKAPGTYQHSLVVANLSEAAAESINANALLTRVGAYYHDIGKMNKPDYFIENQSYMRNPHDKLKPSLSNSVLKAHVKVGLELADKWKLPQAVKNIIGQHHGRTTMLYFYNLALKQAQKNGETVDKEEYRYQGPTPQFKEAAIIALADKVEAKARTLKNPTPAHIEKMVKEMLREKIIEGELDNSDLKFSELNIISDVFVRILTTMYHSRIVYPEESEIEKLEQANK